MLGVPRVTYQNFPFQIVQGDGDDLLMVYPFAAANRVIYMTDRSELPVDSWMGKSDGAWDGDVLVITTKWQNGQSWLDRAGNHASSKLTVTERFTLLGWELRQGPPDVQSKLAPIDERRGTVGAVQQRLGIIESHVAAARLLQVRLVRARARRRPSHRSARRRRTSLPEERFDEVVCHQRVRCPAQTPPTVRRTRASGRRWPL